MPANRRDHLINLAALIGLLLISSGLYEWFGWPAVSALLGVILLGGATLAALK